jgi:site-specific DNA-methyltransferase (adenine-specific)
MTPHTVEIHSLKVPEHRQRKEFKAEEIIKLANSISSIGLIQPVVIRRDGDDIILVAGERRVKAMQYVWNFGKTVKCGEQEYAEGMIPCLFQGEMDPIDAFEMELEENVRRLDLTWQEKAAATSQLLDLRQRQALRSGQSPPTVADIARELKGDSGGAFDDTRKELIVSRYLDDPDVAKAKSADDAFKILKRKEVTQKNADLAELVGLTFTADVHKVLHGDCLDLMKEFPAGSFDVILTDPPYGIDADQYGDSGGRTGGSHFYDDSFETWSKIIGVFAHEAFRVAAAQAHCYVFCDIDNFVFLKSYMSVTGWNVFRTPIIWVNPTAMRAPWPERGPQRKYQLCLYAIKGDRNVIKLLPDVITCQSDENLGHQAQKPVELYTELLRRSIRAGDTVLDPFCGSGPIFPAAHSLKCQATGIEIDPSAYGIAVKRIQDLK